MRFMSKIFKVLKGVELGPSFKLTAVLNAYTFYEQTEHVQSSFHPQMT